MRTSSEHGLERSSDEERRRYLAEPVEKIGDFVAGLIQLVGQMLQDYEKGNCSEEHVSRWAPEFCRTVTCVLEERAFKYPEIRSCLAWLRNRYADTNRPIGERYEAREDLRAIVLALIPPPIDFTQYKNLAANQSSETVKIRGWVLDVYDSIMNELSQIELMPLCERKDALAKSLASKGVSLKPEKMSLSNHELAREILAAWVPAKVGPSQLKRILAKARRERGEPGKRGRPRKKSE